MQLFVTRDSADFAEHVGGFLAGRPIAHNVLATTLKSVDSTDAPLFAWVRADASSKISGVALRTPPRPLLVSSMSEEVADALMPELLEVDPGLPGVTGPEPAASHLAEAWRRCTGGTVAPGMSQGIYWLAQVCEARARPAGIARLGNRSDRDVLIEWTNAFCRDAGIPAIGVESAVDRRLRDGHMSVWENERVVSMVGSHPPVAGVVRLGPSTRRPRRVVTAMPPPSSPTSAAAPWPRTRRSACSTPISPTRPPTGSTERSATGGPTMPRSTSSAAPGASVERSSARVSHHARVPAGEA